MSTGTGETAGGSGGSFRPRKSGRGLQGTRRPLSNLEILHSFDEFLYHGELRDFLRAKQSYERISFSLQTEDFDALIPPCLEVLEFSNHFIRNDTLLCLMHISLGCTLCDLPVPALGVAMRQHAAVLAKHDTMPMLVRSLDFLMGHEEKASVGPSGQSAMEEGMLEREFRLVFNCIYLQLLFHQHDEGFVHSLELGQGRLGASLVSLLFEAIKLCAENEKLPIKKVVLLLLLVLRCLLAIPEGALDPAPPAPSAAEGQSADAAAAAAATAFGAARAGSARSKPPQLKDFQAFSALHLHECSIQRKYGEVSRPAAIDEALRIIRRYEDDFLGSYAFHPSELSFMQSTDFLQDAHQRCQALLAGKVGSEFAPAPSESRLGTTAAALAEAEEDLATCRSAGSTSSFSLRSGAAESVLLRGDVEKMPSSSASTSQDEAASSHVSESSCSEAESSATTAIFSEEDGAAFEGSAGSAAAAGREHRQTRAAGDALVVTSRPLCQEPAAVFERLYLAIFPCLTEMVVLLLRLLLTSCSNVENYPGVVDMARERHVIAIGDEGGLDAGLEVGNGNSVGSAAAFLDFLEKTMPDEAAEVLRHREIMAAAVSGILLILLKQARRSAPEQFSSLAQLITDSNGALVVLKFLNQDLSSAMEPRCGASTPPVLPCFLTVTSIEQPPSPTAVAPVVSPPSPTTAETPASTLAAEQESELAAAVPEPRKTDAPAVSGKVTTAVSPTFASLPSWPACATLRLLEVLYLLCKDSPERVRKYLIHYKAPFILKRLHRIENDQVQRLVLKLLRKQVRYLPRKWKQTNMKAISAIYTAVPMSPLEDWLLNEPLYERFEGPSQADIRASNVLYNGALVRQLASQGRAQSGLEERHLGERSLGYAQLFPEFVPAAAAAL